MAVTAACGHCSGGEKAWELQCSCCVSFLGRPSHSPCEPCVPKEASPQLYLSLPAAQDSAPLNSYWGPCFSDTTSALVPRSLQVSSSKQMSLCVTSGNNKRQIISPPPESLFPPLVCSFTPLFFLLGFFLSWFSCRNIFPFLLGTLMSL